MKDRAVSYPSACFVCHRWGLGSCGTVCWNTKEDKLTDVEGSATVVPVVNQDLTVDPGDKISASLSFKKNLGNYQSIDLYAGVSVTAREGESTSDAWKRAWGIVEKELDDAVERVESTLES